MPKFLQSFALLLMFAFSFSCKKDTQKNEEELTPQAKINDSAMAYIREAYLWYEQVPSSFSGRSFSNLENLMTSIRQFSREPGFANPVDRFSFAIEKEVWDNVSTGSSKDFGLGIFFPTEGDLRIRYVERNSPAEKAGIKRGWRITRINNITNISTTNAAEIVQAVYVFSSITLTVVRNDGTIGNYGLDAADYYADPILLDSIYRDGAKKTGYLVFNSFLGDRAQVGQSFNQIFTKYGAEGVTDMVLDLRYNGGGFVSVKEELANWLAPAQANGQLMMRQQFNKNLQQFNESINFQKKGNLALNRLFVIVSASTASASELLVNNLTPHMQVIILGPSPSNGKPVGYFPIPVGKEYIFPVSFRSVNSRGEGNYFNGFQPARQTVDAMDRDWGDTNDPSLAAALRFIQTGSFGALRPEPRILTGVSAEVMKCNAWIESRNFKGAVVDMKRPIVLD
jgi:carboxyl-terminal processing protease